MPILFSLLPFLALPSVSLRLNFFSASNIAHGRRGGLSSESAFNMTDLYLFADGIDSWREQNVDPAVYPQKLIELVKEMTTYEHKYLENPKQLLIDTQQHNQLTGSCTVALVTVVERRVRVAWLGEMKIFIGKFERKNSTEEAENSSKTNETEQNSSKTSETDQNSSKNSQIDQNSESNTEKTENSEAKRPKIPNFNAKFENEQHWKAFNQPFQMGENGEGAESSELGEADVEEGDLFILLSGGILKNVEAAEAMQWIEEKLLEGKDFEMAAREVMERVWKLSGDKRHFSPFAKEVRKKYNRPYLGGIPDDMTVVVGSFIA